MQNPQGLNTTEALAAILSAADSTHAFSQMARLIRHLKTHKTYFSFLARHPAVPERLLSFPLTLDHQRDECS